jgi:hypothetical protein
MHLQCGHLRCGGSSLAARMRFFAIPSLRGITACTVRLFETTIKGIFSDEIQG